MVGGIGTYINDDLTGLSDCFPVIFDSEVSLAISPSRGDFIGSITPIPDLYIGVMEIVWSLKAKQLLNGLLFLETRHL